MKYQMLTLVAIATGLLLLFIFSPTLTACTDSSSDSKNGANGKDEEKPDPNSVKVTWKDGLSFSTADGKNSLRLSIRIFNDWMWGSPDDALQSSFGPIVSGNEWRAAWLTISGVVMGNMEYEVTLDFAGGDADYRDVYIGFRNLPFGNLRIGHYKEPFGLEWLTASKYTTFMERSLPIVFSPGRNTGFMVFNTAYEQNMTWSVGVFTDANTYGDAPEYDDTYNLTAHVTALPWSEGVEKLAHIGMSYHYRGVKKDSTIRFSSRPEIHLGYNLVDTAAFAAECAHMLDFEGAVKSGRYSVQGEYVATMVDATELGDPNFNGFYIFTSIFLTPDQRGYRKSSGVFTGVKPTKPYGVDGGLGAWEFALRYSRIDLTDGLVKGGRLSDVTLGLNWYPNDNSRIMWNLIHANRDGIGTAYIFQMRFQFHL